MSNNPIAEIKKIEEKAQEIIEQAKKEANFMIADADRRGKQSFERADCAAEAEIGNILEEAKNKINIILKQEKADLKEQIKVLEKIDDKKIEQAADIAIKDLI
jgi:F0F1-type ATP synthase membrane subunit b/b'